MFGFGFGLAATESLIASFHNSTSLHPIRTSMTSTLFGGKLANDAPRQKLVYLSVARHWLADFRLRILIPVVFPAVPNQHGSLLFNFPN